MATELSRQQLHERVWRQPLTKLAAEFGISDVALRKLCIKHRVPTPPVGFWAKLAHGKPVDVTPLPEPEEERVISVGPAFAQEPDALVRARAGVPNAMRLSSAPRVDDPILERTIAKLRKLKASGEGLVHTSGANLISVTVRPDSVPQAEKLLRSLIAAGACAGFRLGGAGEHVAWHVNDQTIEFELYEATDRLAHVATAAEIKAYERWKRERNEYFRRHGYWKNWGEPKIPKWDERHQGRLAIRLESVRARTDEDFIGRPIRGTFAGTRTREIANYIPAIVATIAAMAAAKCINIGVEQRRREAQQLAALRWEVAERRRAHEQAAISLLEQLVDAEHKATTLGRWLNRARSNQEQDNPRVARLVRWAEGRLEQLESSLMGDALEDKLIGASLFADD